MVYRKKLQKKSYRKKLQEKDSEKLTGVV